MKSKGFILVLGALLLVNLIGCNIGKPACDAASLVAVGLGDPPMWGRVGSLTPTLNWTYPDSTCVPEGYTVHLYTGPFFADELGGTSAAASWTVPVPLMPGTEYAWGIQPMAGSTFGPYAGDHYFFTGPSCETGELKQPDLLVPANNALIDDLGSLSLIWDYPDPCLPDGYVVQLSTSLVFDGSPLNGATGNPSTRWGPGDPLDDCTRYYWRVAPYLGEQGQFSAVRTFRVDLAGTCGPETHAMIRGTVWADACAVADGPAPDPLPPGCISDADEVITGNGIFEAGEGGIGDIVVWLGDGACPASGYRAVGTAADGTYAFYALTSGTYCVSIEALDPTNESILIPGTWTFPDEAGSFADWTVTVGPGEDFTNVDFGWWWWMIGDWRGAGPTFVPEINSNCRKGPGLDYEVSTFGLAGTPYPISGRSLDGFWYQVIFNDILRCWMGAAGGEATGDLSQIPYLEAPPLPEQGPNCAQYTDYNSCSANSACTWHKSAVAAGGYCTNK